jgi:hypothetical protein
MDRADEVILARKAAKSRPHGRKPRSTGTKVRQRAGRSREPGIEVEKLKARALELEEKLVARESELAEALGRLWEASAEIGPALAGQAPGVLRSRARSVLCCQSWLTRRPGLWGSAGCHPSANNPRASDRGISRVKRRRRPIAAATVLDRH